VQSIVGFSMEGPFRNRMPSSDASSEKI